MSGKTLAQVLLRVWGIVLIVSAVAAVGNMFLFWQGEGANNRATVVGIALNVIVELAAGIYLVRSGDGLGAWLVSDLDEAEPPAVSAAGIEKIAFGIVGLYFLVSGCSGLAGNLVTLAARKVWDTDVMVSTFSTRGGASAIVKIVAGALLLVRREGLARAWRTIRAQEPADESGD